MERQDLKQKFSSYLEKTEDYKKDVSLACFHQNKSLDEDHVVAIEQMLFDVYGDNIVVCKKALTQENPTINYTSLHSTLNRNLKMFFEADQKSFELYSNGYTKQSLSVYAHCFDKMLNGYSNLSEHELGVIKQSFLSTLLCEKLFDGHKKDNRTLGG